jgi:D-glycero-beta-D-manno-heptose 1-phosphate adenylyltransferase
MGEIIAREKLGELSERLRREGKKIVSTNGCFDILHVGHSRILKESRALGDLLVVGLNSDDSVARLKGPSRPINNQNDRAELLCALSSVDYLTIFTEDTPVEFLRLLKPAIHVKGADYSPDDLEETPVVTGNGGQVVILKLVPGKSTSSIVKRIRQDGD